MVRRWAMVKGHWAHGASGRWAQVRTPTGARLIVDRPPAAAASSDDHGQDGAHDQKTIDRLAKD